MAQLRHDIKRNRIVPYIVVDYRDVLDSLRELLGRNIREVRRSIFALRPVALEELGFYPALCQFIDEFGEQNQVHVDLRVEGSTEQLPPFLELVLFRISD